MKMDWKKYGEYALIGLGIAALGYVGLRAWKSHQANAAAAQQAAADQADSSNSDLLNAVQALTAGGSAEQGAIGAPAPSPSPAPAATITVPPIMTGGSTPAPTPTPTPSQVATGANTGITNAGGAITQTGQALSNGDVPTYANATQAEVGQIFELAFGRAPAQEGLDFWTNAISSQDLTPAQAMQQIIESAAPTDYAKFAAQYPSIAATTPDTLGIAKYSGSTAPGVTPAPSSGNIPGTGMPLPPASPIQVLKKAIS